MRTIIIADGLTKDFLSVEQPFAGARQNVGRAEIDRLMGRGKAYGNGPLPAFLRAATENVRQDAETRLVVLRVNEPVIEMLEERDDAVGVDVAEVEIDHVPAEARGEEPQQQRKGVAVAEDGVRAEPARARHVIREEAAQCTGERVGLVVTRHRTPRSSRAVARKRAQCRSNLSLASGATTSRVGR